MVGFLFLRNYYNEINSGEVTRSKLTDLTDACVGQHSEQQILMPVSCHAFSSRKGIFLTFQLISSAWSYF